MSYSSYNYRKNESCNIMIKLIHHSVYMLTRDQSQRITKSLSIIIFLLFRCVSHPPLKARNSVVQYNTFFICLRYLE